jgi:CheY-like chemotaxis protein
MSDTMLLDGRSALVVDGDFILAIDARDALEEMGMAVVGPFSGVDAALASLQENRPDVAVVDLNLGSGPSFDLVRALTAQAVPTLMVTGYDKNVIPQRPCERAIPAKADCNAPACFSSGPTAQLGLTDCRQTERPNNPPSWRASQALCSYSKFSGLRHGSVLSCQRRCSLKVNG